jgi:hypothetical protein
MARHKYDDPNLSSLEFLLCVMRDPNVLLEHRVKAAEHLLPFTEAKPHPAQPTFNIRLQFMPNVLLPGEEPLFPGDELVMENMTNKKVQGHAH